MLWEQISCLCLLFKFIYLLISALLTQLLYMFECNTLQLCKPTNSTAKLSC